jgi:hypothetical protein
MKAAHPLPLPMRPAGFLLPTLAALALASCSAPLPPQAAAPAPPADQQEPPRPATPTPTPQAATPAPSQAPFIPPEQMAAPRKPPPPSPLAAPAPPSIRPSPPVEPPVNTRVADLLNTADLQQREGRDDGCFFVNLAIGNANDEPTPAAQRVELKRYADRCKLRFQP